MNSTPQALRIHPKYRYPKVLAPSWRLVALLLALTCAYLSSSRAQVAELENWVAASSDGIRQVDVSSLRTTRPIVTYRFRHARPIDIRYFVFVVEVNCDTRTRRDGPAVGFSEYARPHPVDGLGLSFREEFYFVCRLAADQWAAAVEKPPARHTTPSLSSGTGFVVAANQVVTNHHVVAECNSVQVRHEGNTVSARVVTATARNDLALLTTAGAIGISAAVRSMAALGEDITVAGFPLSGLLGNDIIVTSGHVNSLAGLGNDPTMLQVSAPIQPGNSGGPLIDRAGNVVGVVVSKLNVERLSKVTGDLAQNVNFAIKPEMLRLFLDANRVQYNSAMLGQRIDGIQLAEKARQFTVQVICER